MFLLLLRRLLWTLPTLFVVSIVSFSILSFVPDPPDLESTKLERDEAAIAARRRARFADLPRFVNLAPADARARAVAAAGAVAEGGPEAEAGARELARLGGAALPHVVPALDEHDPEKRRRVAVALAPIAARMRLANADQTTDPLRAEAFWRRYWDDRGVEFRPSAVRTAVERLSRYRTTSRASELEELDTYVLPAVFARLEVPRDEPTLETARALVGVASHATGRPDPIPPDATVAEGRACVLRWRAWWLVHEADYTTYDGVARAAAMVKDTRYGKWAAGTAQAIATRDASDLGVARLARSAAVTLGLIFGGVSLAYVVGVVLGIAAAARRRPAVDAAVAFTTVLYAVPAAALATLALGAGAPAGSLLWPVIVVAAGLVALPARHQRAALIETMSADFVRTARAAGASRLRAIIRHGLRNTLPVTATLLVIEPPTTLAAAFVVEASFGLDGLGAAVARAVEARDTSFLMALSIGAAALASVVVLLGDLAHAGLDPRLRGRLAGRPT